MINNAHSNNLGIPVYFNVREQVQDTTKLSEDRYEVFVEDKYVGNKTLFAQNEDFHDVGDFLENHGFKNVDLELNGDHIVVHADDQQEAKAMRQALEVYLKNR